MVLARLLAPEDFGLVAMVAGIVGFVGRLTDMGLTSATVQREKLSNQQVSNLFWINGSLGLLGFVAVVLLSPLVSWFFDEPALVGVTIGLGTVFIISGFSAQFVAVLRRRMRFRALNIIHVLGSGISAMGAIAAAYFGAEYWALVIRSPFAALVTLVVVAVVSTWHPGRFRWNETTREMLKFGRNLTFSSLVSFINRNIDDILIGRFIGKESLGLYDRAYKIFVMPNSLVFSPLGSVMISTLSRLQDEPKKYRETYCRVLQKLILLSACGAALIGVCSDWIVDIILGTGWEPAMPILAVLAFTFVNQPLGKSAGWIYISQDRTHHAAQWSLVGLPITVVAVVVGLNWGALGVATAYSLSALLIKHPIIVWWSTREGPVRARDTIEALLPGYSAGIVSFFGLLGLRHYVAFESSLAGTLAAAATVAVAALLTTLALPSGRSLLRDARAIFDAVWAPEGK